MKKYIVYLTTNLVNKKVYIGIHGTDDLKAFDHYLGNSVLNNVPSTYLKRETPFQCAVAKYGPKNFYRKTLRVFDNLEDALDLERWLVCPEFIERADTYNITLGGGMPPINSINIYQYTLEGKFIKTWESVKDVIQHFGINKDRLRMVIDEKRSMGYSYWSDEYFEELENLEDYRPSARGYLRVYSICGSFKGLYKNGTEVCDAINISRNDLSNHTRRKTPINGYYILKEGEKIEDFLSGKILQSPKIYTYNLSGEFSKEYLNISEVKKELKFNKNDILRAIKNLKPFNDLFWSYSKYNNILKEDPTIVINEPRKVYQYTLEGDFVREWDSITDCRKKFPAVLQVCLGKELIAINLDFHLNQLINNIMKLTIVPFDNNNNFAACAEVYNNKEISHEFEEVLCPVDSKDFWDVKDVKFDTPKNLILYLCYPIRTLVKVEETCNSLYEIINFIRRAYKEIYKSPEKYGIWGHYISDLQIESITIYENKYLEVSIGS